MILWKIIHLKCKMRSKICTSIHIKYQFWYTYVFATTLQQFHMMKNPIFLRNTIFTFMMIGSMILSLFNIVSNYNGNIWWITSMHHSAIGCGVTVVQHNLRVRNCGFLSQDILISLEVVKCCGVSLVVVMERDPMMRQGLW